MSEPVEFSFSRERLLVLALCLALICLLLFGAGVVTGLLISSKPNPSLLSVTPKMLRSARKSPAGSTEQNKTPAAAAQPGTTASPASIAPTVANSGICLQIWGIATKREAEKLAAMLGREGFGPSRSGFDLSQGQQSFFVQLGPYPEWEAAARVANELRRTFDLRASLLPVNSHP